MHANTKSVTLRRAVVIFSLGWMMCNVGFAAMQSRPLPSNATLGILKPSAIPKIVIDGKAYLLTAGAQIRDQKNLLVQTQALVGPDVNVLYKKTRAGQIDRIWILTNDEFQHISNPVKPAPLMPVKKTGS